MPKKYCGYYSNPLDGSMEQVLEAPGIADIQHCCRNLSEKNL